MVLLLGLLNQKSIGPYNFRIIKVGATRTDTAYIETPASIFRVDMPKNDQSLEVDLTELVKGDTECSTAQSRELCPRFATFYAWFWCTSHI
jgi:hypothetical protein